MQKFTLLLLCLAVLLQSCGGPDESFDETSGFTREQLELGIALNFSVEDFAQIKAKRDGALAINHHFKSKKDFVPGVLSCAGEDINIKVRLKGDEVDHLDGNHWSYKLKGKKNLGFGHRKLTIQAPDTKSYLLEYLFHQLCKKEGIISTEYFFVPVNVNDSLKSTYAMTSTIGIQTLIDAGRVVGPMLKFDEKVYWRRLVAGETQIDSVCMLSARIKSCDRKWAKAHKTEQVGAVEKLNDYRSGKLLPNKVFDYDVFARYLAISELLGSSHNLRWINLRLYFDSTSQLFEPIAFDCYDGEDPRNEVIWYNKQKRFEYFLHPLLDDLSFQRKVEKYLKVYCKQGYVKRIFSDNHSELAKYMKLIRKDTPNYYLSRNQMLKRAKYILSTLQ